MCLLSQLLFGVVLIFVTSSLHIKESTKFTCGVYPTSTATFKKLIDQACFLRYNKVYNSPLPLYVFASLSVPLPFLVSVIYSQIVRYRVDEIKSSCERQTGGVQENQRNTFYVFYFYFLHLVLRLLLGVIFSVLQQTYFYPNGFDFKFSCNLPSTEEGTLLNATTLNPVDCENPTAPQKRLSSTLMCLANTFVAFVIAVEVIYLCRRLPFCIYRSGGGWSSDGEFVTTYFLRKKYVPVDLELSDTITGINFYKRCIINRGSHTIDKLYVNTLIHTDIPHKFSRGLARHEIYDTYTKAPPASIRLETTQDLFHPNSDTNDQNPRSILVIGRPGIGKSILATKILRDWANGVDEYYSDKICFLFRLRWFNITKIKDMSLKTFLRFGTTLSEEEFESIYEDIVPKPQEAILIFDGLDEIYGNPTHVVEEACLIPDDPTASMSPLNLFVKLLFGNIFPGATVVVTSRVTAREFYSKLEFNRHAEIMGFTQSVIEEYVTRFCSINKKSEFKSKVWNHIKSSSELLDLCYIPVNCYLVSAILSQSLSEQGVDTTFLPTTLTELYEMGLNHLVKNHKRNTKLVTKEVSNEVQLLAFHGMQDGHLIFDEEYVDDEVKSSVLLNRLANPIFPLQAQFCFVHLTIQEFLAAKHVTDTLAPDEIKKFIFDHVSHCRWHLVLQFIAGLLGKKIRMFGYNKDHIYKNCLWAFADSLEVNDGEIELNDNNIFVMKCLKEADDEEVYEAAVNEVVKVHDKDHSVSASDWPAIMLACKHVKNLSFEQSMSKGEFCSSNML